jgi:16S rRNA (cytidine1402-2'-O)-methyltransferase
VEPIPGASAVLAALSAAGLQSEGFTFKGFPPYRLNNRKRWLQAAVIEAGEHAVVMFEAPHRVAATLQELSLLVEYHILICRELTKVHEELLWGSPKDLARLLGQPKGEFTVVIPPRPSQTIRRQELTDSEIAHEFGQMTANEPGRTRRETVRNLAKKLGLPVKAVYSSLERAKLG